MASMTTTADHASDPSDGTPLFRMRGVTKRYVVGDSEILALRGVDFELFSGEMLVLLGASGSGKSTLLNILGGLDSASSGSVRYRDLELCGADDSTLTAFRREHVGFVFQFYNLIPSLTARENVAIVTEIAKDPMPVDEALQLVGLGERSDHFPAQLSGGEQQRVALSTTTAIITHNASIGAMADRVVHLSDGQIASIESNEERAAPESLSW